MRTNKKIALQVQNPWIEGSNDQKEVGTGLFWGRRSLLKCHTMTFLDFQGTMCPCGCNMFFDLTYWLCKSLLPILSRPSLLVQARVLGLLLIIVDMDSQLLVILIKIGLTCVGALVFLTIPKIVPSPLPSNEDSTNNSGRRIHFNFYKALVDLHTKHCWWDLMKNVSTVMIFSLVLIF